MAQHSWSPIKKETTQFWVLVSVLIGTFFFLIAPPVLYLICNYRSNRAVGQEQAILVLGGNWTRIASIKPIITKLPQIPVVMSFTQVEAQYGLMVLERYGVPKSQIFHDCRAVDTVSNFTTTIDFFTGVWSSGGSRYVG